MVKLIYEVIKVIDFLAKNWVNILLVFVGTFALIIYKLQERRKRIDAASLIILQIDEIQERLREISTYIVEGQLNEAAFYESLPLMEENYWSKYKHYFVRDMDATSYASLNHFYNYVSEIQEQQLLMKNLQKNNFSLTQTVLVNIEAQFIIAGLCRLYGKLSPEQFIKTVENMILSGATEEDKKNFHIFVQQVIEQNPNFDFKQFWDIYRQQDERLKAIINNGALTSYIPVQIRISLDKMLKEYSMLEIVGTAGYQLLKTMSKKKF